MITIKHLTAGYGKLEILQDLSLSFAEQQFSVVLGPNGSGKSTLMKAIMGLNRVFGGSIQLKGRELIGTPTEDIPRLGIAHVPQRDNIFGELTVRENLQLGVRSLPKAERPTALKELLDIFPILGRRGAQRAVTLSGGEHQMLAIAIACHPQVLIADEPTTALDVTIQAQILQLIRRLLVDEQGTGVLLITHDLGVVAQVCDRVAVMYAGKIVEFGDVHSIFANPLHPYTQALLNSLPSKGIARGRLENIQGRVPGLADRPAGCRFHPRCPQAKAVCRERVPPLRQVSARQEVACVLYD